MMSSPTNRLATRARVLYWGIPLTVVETPGSAAAAGVLKTAGIIISNNRPCVNTTFSDRGGGLFYEIKITTFFGDVADGYAQVYAVHFA